MEVKKTLTMKSKDTKKLYVDVEIELDGTITLQEAHDIAENNGSCES